MASDALAAAVAAELGPLLEDPDVVEIGSLEGGTVDVLRRGRRQRLEVILEGPLFALLREAGAERSLCRLRLPHGHELIAGPLADGRLALRLVSASPFHGTLEALVAEGVLPAGVEAELRAAVLEGAGVVLIGPARVARRRVLAAIMRSLADRFAFFGISDSLSSMVPVPLPRGAALLDKARAALALGADALCALDITAREASELARAELGVPLVVSIAASSMAALSASLLLADLSVNAVGGTTAVLGYGLDGEARLVEMHGPTRTVAQLARPGAASLTSRGLSQPPAAVNNEAAANERPRTPRDVIDDLPPLADLPEAWASNDADADPGWELGETGSALVSKQPAAGSFDAALAARKGTPSFAPRPSRAQLGAGHPFGGLTFEPPPGGPPSPDDDEQGPR